MIKKTETKTTKKPTKKEIIEKTAKELEKKSKKIVKSSNPVKDEKKVTKTRPVKPKEAKPVAEKKPSVKAVKKPIETPTMDSFPSIKKGDENGYVTLLQTNLKNRGYYDGPVDAKFGDRTEKALNDFQKDAKKPQNSIVGAKTWELLQKSTVVKIKPEPPKADIQPQQVRGISEQPKAGVSVIVEGLTRYQADLLVKLFQGNTVCHIV